MNAVNNQCQPDWKDTISPRFGNEIRLQRQPSTSALSQSEMDILDAVVQEHLPRTTEELVQWCHDNCREYEQVLPTRRKPISVEAILKASGKSNEKIKEIVKEAESIEEMAKLMA